MKVTHKITNQSTILENYNLFESDQSLCELLEKHNVCWAIDALNSLGCLLGSSQWIEKGFQVNKYLPEFQPYDSRGYRMNSVKYHPAYHELMGLAFEYQIPSLPWTSNKKGVHLQRMALNYLYNQNEAGSACPLTMSFAAVPVLNKYFNDKSWQDKILNNEYDSNNLPAHSKKALTIGMAMTEKQGGTDVRANTSSAQAIQKSKQEFELTGHKWFCSAPMSDAFLTLAQTQQGLSCFLLPRWRPDGELNQIFIQRLKDKMGNRSNASSEIEFDQAFAWLLGEKGRGVATIIEMVALTRYDCMIGSSALMRQALVQVTHHISQRKVFGKKLSNHALMQNVVADLTLETEAALYLTARVAIALDEKHHPKEQELIRLLTAIGKYWICKRALTHIGEAQECMGGIGYIEDNILARLYREAPVNSIWEGSANVQCLDVIKYLEKSPSTLDVYFEELQSVSSHSIYLDYITCLKTELQSSKNLEFQARYFVEKMALAMQACQLLKYGHKKVAHAFCLARLKPHRGLNFGNLEPSIDCEFLIKRASPD